ncbi:hypothetical protein B0T19DRAFT_397995 [Cercophora scortea]|uniref:Uncharacterized protein n=1 Tax=Cercophora scortea TaxID=314031 RepID=A0AAE0MHT3_9PEZI|nr:hypothetical protein B0T19DRAFT_397995 [Cercophora scortea]
MPPKDSRKVYKRHRVGPRETPVRPKPTAPPARASPPRTQAYFQLRSVNLGETPAGFKQGDANPGASSVPNPDHQQPQPPSNTFNPYANHHQQHAFPATRPPPLAPHQHNTRNVTDVRPPPLHVANQSSSPIRPVPRHPHEAHGHPARSSSPVPSQTPFGWGSAESFVPPTTKQLQPQGMQAVAIQAFLAIRNNQPLAPSDGTDNRFPLTGLSTHHSGSLPPSSSTSRRALRRAFQARYPQSPPSSGHTSSHRNQTSTGTIPNSQRLTGRSLLHPPSSTPTPNHNHQEIYDLITVDDH